MAQEMPSPGRNREWTSSGTQGLRQERVQEPALTSEHNVKNHLLQNLASGWGSSAVRANLSSISL